MAKPDARPPEAQLIAERRKARMPGLSIRSAATAATADGVKMSEATWRSIENGIYDGPPDKVAIMAAKVGVTPEELDEFGRRGRENCRIAAGMLRTYLKERAANEPALAGVDTAATPSALLQMIIEGIDDIRNAEALSPDQKRSLERSLIHAVTQTVAGQLVQVRTTLQIVGEKARQT